MLIKSNLLLIGDNVYVHATKFIFGLCLSSRTILSSVLLKNSMHTHWELMHLGIIIIIGMRGYSVPSIYVYAYKLIAKAVICYGACACSERAQGRTLKKLL